MPERVWRVGVLVQGCSVPWRGLELGSHADTAARPICASHTVTITELLTLEASSSHIAVKPLTMPCTPIPKARSYSAAAWLPLFTHTIVHSKMRLDTKFPYFMKCKRKIFCGTTFYPCIVSYRFQISTLQKQNPVPFRQFLGVV